MTARPRGGFTLIEVSVVVVMVGLLAVGLHQAYLRHSRFVDWQGQVAMANDAFRVSGSLLSADLREAVPQAGDIALLDSDSLRVRTARGLAFVCAVSLNPARLGLYRVTGRMPEAASDSVMVYATTGWRSIGAVTAETAGAGGLTCFGRAPATQLRLPAGAAADVPVGAPLRVYRPQVYHVASNGGRPWLARTGSDGTEPLVGPLAPNGLRFRAVDANGNQVTDLSLLEGVEFRLVLPGRSRPGVTTVTVDTVLTVLQVRNR